MTAITLLPPALVRPERSLAATCPEVAKDWDYEGNFPYIPAMVAKTSRAEASWICPKHGVYRKRINRRTEASGTGCPKCRKPKTVNVKPGRSLAETFPDVAAQWDYEANHPVTPADVTGRSNKKAYFICPVGHGSHESYISNRTAGHGCPECAPRRSKVTRRKTALASRTLASSYPDVAAQWHPELNELTPEDVPPFSLETAWWICRIGHAPFQAVIGTRSGGSGCPECGRLKRQETLAQYRGTELGASITVKRPDLLPFWDQERNELSPDEVAPYSRKIVQWTCAEGHRYEAKAIRRSSAKRCLECIKEERAA